MMHVFELVLHALLMAAAMGWQVAWSVVLGFVLSGVIQAVVSREMMVRQLGAEGIPQIARATAYGAASSSCSYASVAITKSLLARGAGLLPSLAFLFASTNLVIELGIVLWRLMGWQFALAEWLGGIILVTVMSILAHLTYPKHVLAEARLQANTVSIGHDHASETAPGTTFWQRLRAPETRGLVAQSFAMDWSMLRGDLVIGFIIAGCIASFVPSSAWQHIFFSHLPPMWRSAADAMIAPLIAVITFVCSIGNVPLAAALWSGGVGFSGVIAFLYADLLVLPILDVYRKAFGIRMAAYIAGIFYITMAISGFLVNQIFAQFHLVPVIRPEFMPENAFRIDATFWLNLIAAIVVGAIVAINRGKPKHHCCHG
jgi:uncharacterized membrane protein YraQ (UPF0718 family)